MPDLPRDCPRHLCGVGRFCVLTNNGRVFARNALSGVVAARAFADVTVRYPVQRFTLYEAQAFIRDNLLSGCVAALI